MKIKSSILHEKLSIEPSRPDHLKFKMGTKMSSIQYAVSTVHPSSYQWTEVDFIEQNVAAERKHNFHFSIITGDLNFGFADWDSRHSSNEYKNSILQALSRKLHFCCNQILRTTGCYLNQKPRVLVRNKREPDTHWLICEKRKTLSVHILNQFFPSNQRTGKN